MSSLEPRTFTKYHHLLRQLDRLLMAVKELPDEINYQDETNCNRMSEFHKYLKYEAASVESFVLGEQEYAFNITKDEKIAFGK